MKVLKKIGAIILDICIVLLLIASVTILTISLTSRENGVGNIGGYAMLSVQTDSMEPTINVGDLIICKLSENKEDYEVGDIVTFREIIDNNIIFNTHRIVEKGEVNGVTMYNTKGDNAPGEDPMQLVAGDIIASYEGTRIPKIGSVLDFLRSQKGFFVCILLPMIILFIIQLYKFIRNLIEYNAEKAKDEAAKKMAELTEEQKRAAINEYLESVKKDNKGNE